jgi:hypothetical protein
MERIQRIDAWCRHEAWCVSLCKHHGRPDVHLPLYFLLACAMRRLYSDELKEGVREAFLLSLQGVEYRGKPCHSSHAKWM